MALSRSLGEDISRTLAPVGLNEAEQALSTPLRYPLSY